MGVACPAPPQLEERDAGALRVMPAREPVREPAPGPASELASLRPQLLAEAVLFGPLPF